MTRESWHSGTYSHGWGTSALVGVSWGILGVHVTAPGWASFTITPKLGSLTRAAGTVPTLRGFIAVNATLTSLDVAVPCGAAATLCTPRAAALPRLALGSTALSLDGADVAAVERKGHLCLAAPVGCGKGGAPRELRWAARV
jgi:hypothetical protein